MKFGTLKLPLDNQSLHVVGQVGANEPFEFNTRCLTADDPTNIEIVLPDDVDSKNVEPGMQITLEYAHQDAFYSIDARIEEVLVYSLEATNQISKLILTPVAAPKRLQRREHFRLDEQIRIELCPVELPDGYVENQVVRQHHLQQWQNDDKLRYLVGESFDLSGGGFGILLSQNLKTGSHVLIRFKLSSTQYFCICTVRFCEKDKASSKLVYRVGLQFIGLMERERDQIIQYIFQRQNQRLHWQKEME